MSIIRPITVAVYLISFICRVSSFQVSQIQFQYLFTSKISCEWILDKREDLHFLTCTQMCWGNSDCSGIALGPLKENRVDYKRDCYLLKKSVVSEQYCTVGDYDEEEVEFYEKIEPESISSTTSDEPTMTAEEMTTEKASTSVETSLSDDTTTTEMNPPKCDGYLVSEECPENRERSVIVGMKSSSDYLTINGATSMVCAETEFAQQDIMSPETISRPFDILDINFQCETKELFAGYEICYSDGGMKYSYYKCKELLDGFFKGRPLDSYDNKDHPSEIRCPEGTLMDIFKYSESDGVASAFCVTLFKA